MKKLFLVISLIISLHEHASALIINEIMSNPVGDDGGREWIELYNNSSTTIDLSSLSISIKGGVAVSVLPVSGGTTIPSEGYAIIGSVVSGATKFLQDYPTYSGPLFKSSISLVNTGVTSVEVKLNGISSDQLSSYTAAKEGSTLSRVAGNFVVSTPTPGSENQSAPDESVNQSVTTSSTTNTQATIAQASIPIADIVIYLPQEKTVVAGAEAVFSAFGLSHTGKQIDNLLYTWSFGDGGQGVGSSTLYRYAYPGRYVATVESGNGYVLGSGRMNVRVVAPDILIKSFGSGKYGAYIDVENPNTYELDLSQWRLVIDGASFPFPKNTFLLGNNITHISGVAMGFASTTITDHSVIKIVFPNLEEVTRLLIPSVVQVATSTDSNRTQVSMPVKIAQQTSKLVTQLPQEVKRITQNSLVVGKVPLTKNSTTTSDSHPALLQKDTRMVAFFRSFF